MYDINSFTSLSRLVKGRVSDINQSATASEEQDDELKIDSKKFEILFKMCYDQLRNDKSSREKLQRMLKGQIASSSRKATNENYPNLTAEDLKSIKTFSKQSQLSSL